MQFYTLTFLIILGSILASSFGTKIETFKHFKQIFNKKYASLEDEAIAEKNFLASLRRIQKIHLENPTVELGINQYSDMVSI